MNRFNACEGMIVASIAVALVMSLTNTLHAAENKSTGDSMTQEEKVEQAGARQKFEADRVKVLSDVLVSNKGYVEKERAAKSLGAMRSQSAASALLETLMSVKSVVRMGPQMQAVIGMYPCALALVENGTNSVSPVIEHIQCSEREDVQRVCQEVLKRIQCGVGAASMIENKLSLKLGKEERARLETTLKYLQRSSAGKSKTK